MCAFEDFADGERKVVYVGGKQAALFNVAGKLYAISNRCSHARGPLSEGQLEADNCTVTCPWHYAKFDLQTGQVVDGIASSGVPTFAVEVRNGMIFVGTGTSSQNGQ